MSFPWCKNFGHQAGLAVAWYACERTSRSLHAVVGLVARPSLLSPGLRDGTDQVSAQPPRVGGPHTNLGRAGAQRPPQRSARSSATGWESLAVGLGALRRAGTRSRVMPATGGPPRIADGSRRRSTWTCHRRRENARAPCLPSRARCALRSVSRRAAACERARRRPCAG